jgi:hypothetical protein
MKNKIIQTLSIIIFNIGLSIIATAQNAGADLYIVNNNTLKFFVRSDNNVILGFATIPAIDINGSTFYGAFNSNMSYYIVDYSFAISTTNSILSDVVVIGGGTDVFGCILNIDSLGNIHFGNPANNNETTDYGGGMVEIFNEQNVLNSTITNGLYSGTITNVSDISDTFQMLMSNNGIVKIQCTDGTMVTGTTSGYNNAMNTINFSAIIPNGKTVARILASHAWIDVPDVMSAFALPIEIVSFTGKEQENEYQLTLEIAKEWNVQQFELERSIDGKTYESIETLLPVNSFIYNFIDRNPSQINFYRIKVVDIDEHIMYSKVLNYSKTNIDRVKLYPNPTTNILTIELPQRKTNQTIYIKNLFGQIVYKQEILDKQFETINTESLSKGNYILQVVSTSQTLTTKFSKE